MQMPHSGRPLKTIKEATLNCFSSIHGRNVPSINPLADSLFSSTFSWNGLPSLPNLGHSKQTGKPTRGQIIDWYPHFQEQEAGGTPS